MRKIILLASIVFAVFSAQAQLFNVAGIDVGYLYVGPKLGGNVSTMSTKYVDVAGTTINKGFNLGYQFGAVAKLGITKKLSIQPELVYTSKGLKEKTDNQWVGEGEATKDYKYFGLPVIAKYAFASLWGVDVYGAAGFYTNVLTGYEGVYVYEGGEEYEDEHHEDLSSSFKRVDFGFSIGAGASMELKNKDILAIDLTVAQGVVNMHKDIPAFYSYTNTSSKNTSVQLTATYLFDLTKWINFKGSNKAEDAYEENSAPAGGSKIENR